MMRRGCVQNVIVKKIKGKFRLYMMRRGCVQNVIVKK